MKKLIAVLLCVATIFCLTVPALAEESPKAEEQIKVTVITKPGTTGVTNVYKVGTEIVAEFDPTAGDFDSWAFYKADGTIAVENVDYVIVEGSKTTGKIRIKSLVGHLYVVANYDGKVTNPITGDTSKPTSPTTGDSVMVYFSVIMLAGAAIVLSSKKVLCK